MSSYILVYIYIYIYLKLVRNGAGRTETEEKRGCRIHVCRSRSGVDLTSTVRSKKT
jgi:hypothetical protein